MTQRSPSRHPSRWVFAALTLASGSAWAAPTAVSTPGSYQSEAGCASDWDPACDATQLTYDANDDVWQGTFAVPAGSYEFKAALNKDWAVNYGAGGVQNGPNIPLSLAADAQVKFYYDDKTHWVTSNHNSVIATVPGSFQSELGCPGDWQPDCLRSWLQDVDGDGIYTLTTATALPAGTYEGKVAINEGWTENYGAGGAANGANLNFTVPEGGSEVTFTWDSGSKVLNIVVGSIRGDLAKAKAFWLTRDTLAWNVVAPAGATFKLHHDAAGTLKLDPTGVLGGESFALSRVDAGLSTELRAKFPHLQNYSAFRVAEADLPRVKELLRGQVAISATGADGKPVDATGLQFAGALDDLYPYTGELGVSWSGGKPTLRLWAPTAQDVKLLVFPDATSPMSSTVTMTRDEATGVWTAPGEADWKNKYYLYEVKVYSRAAGKVSTHTVTDPYSISLAINSQRSQVVDLDDPALKPQGWDSVAKPALAAPEDIVLYELHIRDFSATDATVPESHRGGYLAFTDRESNGMKHLSRLAKAGLTHVHLLPTFDIASVNEDRSTWEGPGDLTQFPGNSGAQREAVKKVVEKDAFNWGYDPFHFGVPEGSYSTDPNGPARILEFRQMVKSLNETGLRVVMDVVYNHTNASGLSDKSVLDKVVPDYYHRLNLEGGVERSTCCENTATEHAMMEKLMVDTLKLWTRAYKVDGYRFDLMGHHMKSNMLKVRQTLSALTPAADGVDGSKVYVYGEGWNFGEVENNARGQNAVQRNMAGTGIGSFNDRLRDAARGGGPFSPRPQQGFLTGLYFAPNDLEARDQLGQHETLLHFSDLLRAGVAATLSDYSFTDATGRTGPASSLDYNGQGAGYTADPQEVINYISAHDNETLFDAIQVKVPLATDMDGRVRVNNLGVSLIMLSQGIPFFHAGDEVLRSKSGDHNSYNSGDWFNRLDWTYQTNNWGVGLPINSDDAVLTPLLARPELKPTQAHILRALDHFEEMLKIRKSSKLFRLETADQVKAAVKFLNVGPKQDPGLIVVSTTNTEQFPDEYEQVVTVFNAAPYDQTFRSEELKGAQLRLHPVQQASTDPAMRRASFNAEAGAIVVPARSAAVFVKGKLEAQPGEGEAAEGCGGCAAGGSTGLALVGLLLMAHVTRRRGARA